MERSYSPSPPTKQEESMITNEETLFDCFFVEGKLFAITVAGGANVPRLNNTTHERMNKGQLRAMLPQSAFESLFPRVH